MMAPPPVAERDLVAAIATLTGLTVRSAVPLAGGMIGDVHRVTLADGRTVVSKYLPGPTARLDLEAVMLTALAAPAVVPLPRLEFVAPELLLMEHMPGGHVTPAAERSLGTMVAALHAVTGPAFGFDGPTLNGTVVLPNGWSTRWVPFFRDQRIRFTADLAASTGRLTHDDHRRVERLCERLDDLLIEPTAPALLHGDLWRANVLSVGSGVTALLDPSTLFGHPELEIAYALGTGLGQQFLHGYTEHHPLDPGFFTLRRHVYFTYPALMHVLYFGERYRWMLESALTGSGC